MLEQGLRPLTNGRLPNHWLAKFPPNAYQYPKGTVRLATINEIQFQLDLSDFVDWHLYWGIRDKGRERLFQAIQPGVTFLDVGANMGEFSLKAKQMVGEKGAVIAFEPDPSNFERLKKNLALNPSIQVTAVQKALGEAPGYAWMHAPRTDNSGTKRIAVSDEGIQVVLDTLDEAVARLKLERMDWLKIDVEGYEWAVLRGGQKTLKRFHPNLFIEIDEANLQVHGSSAAAVIGWLAALGYQMEEAVTGRPVTAQDDFQGCHFDLWAVWNKNENQNGN